MHTRTLFLSCISVIVYAGVYINFSLIHHAVYFFLAVNEDGSNVENHAVCEDENESESDENTPPLNCQSLAGDCKVYCRC